MVGAFRLISVGPNDQVIVLLIFSRVFSLVVFYTATISDAL